MRQHYMVHRRAYENWRFGCKTEGGKEVIAIPVARPPMQFAVAGAMRIWSAHRESSI